MIYCGSISDFGKTSVLVPDPDRIWQFFNKFFSENLAYPMSEAA
jgi:hypothetical protein